MSRVRLLLLFFAVVLSVTPVPVAGAAAMTQQLPPESQLERDVRAVSAELRCPVCQGLSLADSPSELSQEMKDVVRQQLEAGRSPDEVKAYFVSKYGEWILLEPKPEGFNLAVYMLPVVGLLLGGLFLFLTARRWVQRGGDVERAIVAETEEEARLHSR